MHQTLSLLVVASLAAAALSKAEPLLRLRALERRQGPSPDTVTSNSSPLRKQRLNSGSNGKVSSSAALGLAQLDTLPNLTTVEITIGGQNFSMILDSGSSDTWAARTGFTCVDANNVASDICGFDNTFDGDFSQGEIPDQHFFIQYGGGQTVLGRLGFETVTLGGITVPTQEVALVERAFFGAIPGIDGILGLAFPLLTSAHAGRIEDASFVEADHDNETQFQYDPVFFGMVKQSGIAPVFSIALDRDDAADDGFIAFGGIPQVATVGAFASSPIQILDVFGGGREELLTGKSFYTITPDAVLHAPAGRQLKRRAWARDAPMSTRIQRDTKFALESRQQDAFPVIVDSGVVGTLLPEDLVNAVAAEFDPPAFLTDSGLFAPCNASVPQLTFQIGGALFPVDARDLLRGDQKDESGENCLLGISPGGKGPFVLGDTFMNNVLAVFDIGAGEMRFALRA